MSTVHTCLTGGRWIIGAVVVQRKHSADRAWRYKLRRYIAATALVLDFLSCELLSARLLAKLRRLGLSGTFESSRH